MFHEPEHTVEYRLGFELDAGSGQWFWLSDVYYTQAEAEAAFKDKTKKTNMNWRLRKDEIVTTTEAEYDHKTKTCSWHRRRKNVAVASVVKREKVD